jgi:hypothetical protein
MLGKIMVVATMLVIPIAAAADNAKPQVNLSASDIVSKNVTARGGLQAWRSVKAMKWEGKMGAGGNQRAPIPTPAPGKKGMKLPTDPRPKDEVQLPFVMEMERPRKVHYELQFRGQTAVQTYDGVNGWKLRPYLNRLEVEPFTPEELKASSQQFELDGPLVDYVAKGTRIELEGTEKVESRDAYKLKLTMKDGHTVHVWIDAGTYLESKIEGQPRRLDGIEHPVEVYYSDYRPVNGLQIPFVLETKVLPITQAAPLTHAALSTSSSVIPTERIVLDKVEVNPRLDESHFKKPDAQMASLIRH